MFGMLNMWMFHHNPDMAALADKLADKVMIGCMAVPAAIKAWNKAVMKHDDLKDLYKLPVEGYDRNALVRDLRRCADQLK